MTTARISPFELVPVEPRDITRFAPLFGPGSFEHGMAVINDAAQKLRERRIWTINSTAYGGGVAEMLPPIVGYIKGLDIPIEWGVIGASEPFFQVTKRLHHAIHGSPGGGTPLDQEARRIYEDGLVEAGHELLETIQPEDVVILHDPQTAGLAPLLHKRNILTVWRCHIGTEQVNPETELGWAFLAPYLADVSALIFTREAYVPARLRGHAIGIIPPSIDPFASKNMDLSDGEVDDILQASGLLVTDGSPTRIARVAVDSREVEVFRHVEMVGEAPLPADVPWVTQVSRWDPLKDFSGVMTAFHRYVTGGAGPDAHLVLAGPGISTVADDPEAASTFEEILAGWRALPDDVRRRVHIVNLPMDDRDENALIVNALQRHSAIVVQKSLEEGFGLTVTEAMWKARPVIASARGGIKEQISSGFNGVLVEPDDYDAVAAAIARLLSDASFAAEMGRRARERVRSQFMAFHTLVRYARLLVQVEGGHIVGGQVLDLGADHA